MGFGGIWADAEGLVEVFVGGGGGVWAGRLWGVGLGW